MADPRELRQSDVRAVEEELAAARSVINQLRAETSADPEDTEYELMQQQRYVAGLEAELQELNSSPVVAEGTPMPHEVASTSHETAAAAAGLAVVVGHSVLGKDPGAKGTGFPSSVVGKMRYEVHWNTQLADMIHSRAKEQGLRCEVFTRDRKRLAGIRAAYRKVGAWGPKAAVELHFNSFNGAACGTETLYHSSPSKSWGQEVQGRMHKVFHEAAIGKNISRPRGPWPDRLLKHRTNGQRGYSSVAALGSSGAPSVLIEPFFGDNEIDATIAQEQKKALADVIVEAYIAQFEPGHVKPTTPGPGPDPGPGGTMLPTPDPDLKAKPDRFSPELWELWQVAARTKIEFPNLRNIAFAQWCLETGWGYRGRKAKYHTNPELFALEIEAKNFGGMKYRKELKDLCTKYWHTDHNGKSDYYCKFESLDKFIEAYWKRFDATSFYPNWRSHTGDENDFINYIGDIWAPPSDSPNNVGYADKVRRCLRWLKENDYSLPTTNEDLEPPLTRRGSSGKDAELLKAVIRSTESAIKHNDLLAATDNVPDELKAAAGSFATEGRKVLELAKTSLVPWGGSLVELVRKVEPDADKVFVKAAAALDKIELASQDLRLAILAHWALESKKSTWGTSELARTHFNLAGIRWQKTDSPAVDSVLVSDKGLYFRFINLDTFLDFYFQKLRTGLAEDALETKKAEDFVKLVARGWHVVTADTPAPAPDPAEYTKAILGIVERLREANALAGADDDDPAADGQSGSDSTAPSHNKPDGVPDTGVALYVSRQRVERRSSGRPRVRTVGEYQVYLDGKPLSDPMLKGMMLEAKGPGANVPAQNGKRIEADVYPLRTHRGKKYMTFDFKATRSSSRKPRPGIQVGEADQTVSPVLKDRVAILLHPGSGFLWSVGCLNPSKPLSRLQGMSWADSFDRTMALIDAMKKHVPGFPSSNGKRIPDTVLVVEGEPMHERSLLEIVHGESSATESVGVQISPEMISRLTTPKVAELLRDSINGSVLPDLVDAPLFALIKSASDARSGSLESHGSTGGTTILQEPGPEGDTLWHAWVEGWIAAQAHTDAEVKAKALADLESVAQSLVAAGVDINAPSIYQTPLTYAAVDNAAGAVERLVAFGADVDRHDPMGTTPLVAAAYFGADAAVSALLAANANRDLRSLPDNTDAQEAQGGGDEVAELFAEDPPANATPLEAARAALALIPDEESEGSPRRIALSRIIADLS